jgi:parallel beta-helix repeat protein/YD repeat-containing protein
MYAIYLTRNAVGVVEHNTALNDDAGLLSDRDSDATVVDNTFSSTNTYGILIESTAGVTLLDSNIANHNDESGIEVNKPGTIVRMNTARQGIATNECEGGRPPVLSGRLATYLQHRRSKGPCRWAPYPASNRCISPTQTNGKIEKITDPSSSPLPSRVYDYVYDGSELDKYIDPAGDTTDYDYTNGRLTKITDPKGSITKITYESGFPYRVKTIKRVTDTANDTGPTTTFTYNSSGSCTTNEGRTVVTDPEGHNTIYCWETGDRVVKVRDANLRTRSVGYNSNSEVNTYTSPSYATLNVSVSLNSNSDNSLTDITVPTGSGTLMTSSFKYDPPETPRMPSGASTRPPTQTSRAAPQTSATTTRETLPRSAKMTPGSRQESR